MQKVVIDCGAVCVADKIAVVQSEISSIPENSEDYDEKLLALQGQLATLAEMQNRYDGRIKTVQLSQHEIEALYVPPSAEVVQSNNKMAAALALQKSDIVAIRCVKAGVPFPQEWVQYVNALRDALTSGNNIPDQPPYPEGT